MVTIVFTRKQGVIINKTAKLKPSAYGALINQMKETKSNNFMFIKDGDERYIIDLKKSVTLYFKDITQCADARLRDIKPWNSNVLVYMNLKRIARLNVSKVVMATKMRMLFTFIAAVNDHQLNISHSRTALVFYIDARWIFGFLKKKDIHPKLVMNSGIIESLLWHVAFLESFRDTKFVNF